MDIFCIGYGAFAVLHEIRGAGVQQIVIIPSECFNIFRGQPALRSLLRGESKCHSTREERRCEGADAGHFYARGLRGWQV